MARQHVRYIEEYPEKMDVVMSNERYNLFFKKRFDEICKILDLFKPDSKYNYYDWKHKTTKINKDGTPRKYYGANHLQTKKSKEKQKLKFREHLEKVRKESEIRRLQKQKIDLETYKQAIKILIQHNIDLNRLDIKIKR